MNFKLIFHFFLSGFLVGGSICVASCGILLLPLMVKIGERKKETLFVGFSYGIGRVIAFGILGAIASYSNYLLKRFIENKISLIIGGIFLFLIGIWYFFSKQAIKGKKIIKNLPPFFLGIVHGFLPCGPVIGFLLYLVYVSEGILFGILSGILFGIGSLIVPVFLFWGVSSFLKEKIRNSRKAILFLKVMGTAIFIFWGVNLILYGIGS